MEICSGTMNQPHAEICYDERGGCPLCEALNSLAEAQKERDNLQDELNNIE